MRRPILTREQRLFAYHQGECFLQACPGSGKTRAIIGRICRISRTLPPRKGIAVLSFTNTAVDEFKERCHALRIDETLRHPGYVGTFDAFVRHFIVLPAGIPGVDARPAVVDSWSSLGIDVRLRGQSAFRGAGVPLDRFDAQNGTIDPAKIGRADLRKHVRDHLAAYQKAAATRRRGLLGKGYLSAADARVVAFQNLKREGWADSLGTALAARFEEVVVDEAQDCNPIDLALLNWLREYSLPVTVVCDPDQAIYGFRPGNPDLEKLSEFAATYDDANRLELTGNFRSSTPICSIAATLRRRATPDNALGDNDRNTIPVQIISYDHDINPATIGGKFWELADAQRIKLDQAFILAHQRKFARRVAGLLADSEATGASKVALVARAVGAFRSSLGSGRAREIALRDIEKLILQLTGKIEENEPVRRAIERNEINSRWLRRTAMYLVNCLPAVCDDTDEDRAAWLDKLHKAIKQCGLEYAAGKTATSFFARRGSQDWNKSLQPGPAITIRCATVHEAKGREYDSVCLVIPPDRAPHNHTEQLFTAWENQVNDEAKRVAYVAVTRAKKLLAVATPAAYQDRLIAILDGAKVAFDLHELGEPDHGDSSLNPLFASPDCTG